LNIKFKDQRKYIQAEHALKKAIDLNPQDEGIYVMLSQVYYLQGKTADSEGIFKRVISICLPENLAIVPTKATDFWLKILQMRYLKNTLVNNSDFYSTLPLPIQTPVLYRL